MDYSNLIIALGLSAIVPINMFFQRYFAKREGRLELFRSHFSCHGIDWLFVIFNFLWIYSVTLNLFWGILALGISLVVNFVSHYYLSQAGNGKCVGCHMFDGKKKKILPAGIVHFVFATIELVLLLIFLFADISSVEAYLATFVMLVFFVLVPYGSMKMHGKVIPYDWVFFGGGIIGISLKLVFLLI